MHVCTCLPIVWLELIDDNWHNRKKICNSNNMSKNVPSGRVDSKGPDQNAQFDHGLHCLLTESLDSIEWSNGEQRSEWYFVHAQDDLNLHFAHVRRHFFSWRGPVSSQSGVMFWCEFSYWNHLTDMLTSVDTSFLMLTFSSWFKLFCWLRITVDTLKFRTLRFLTKW